MGKASKWMMNFLLGRKDEKEKKKNISFPAEYAATKTTTKDAMQAANPNIKRRWSFGRSANKEKTHKSSKSFDTNAVTPLMALTNHHGNAVPATKAAERITRAIENAAAVKIQAVFRSHLVKNFQPSSSSSDSYIQYSSQAQAPDQSQAQAQTQTQARRSSSSSSQYSKLKEVAHENRDPWFIKLYRSSMVL